MYTLPDLPCALPANAIQDDINLEELRDSFIRGLEVLGEDQLSEIAIWRDLYALTSTLRTFYTQKSISQAWKETSQERKPVNFTAQGQPTIFRLGEFAWVNIPFTFETTGSPATTCSGVLSVAPDDNAVWKIWMLRTVLEQLKSQPSVDVLSSKNESSGEIHTNGSLANGSLANGSLANGSLENGSLENGTDEPYECVLVGAGQAGLSVAGRLKALGVRYLVIEKNAEVGDNWKLRYESAKLHTVRDTNHLPFNRTFPSDWPVYLGKDYVAKAYQQWATEYDINIWLSTTLLSGSWDADKETWELKIRRNDENLSIRCSHVVFAVGGGSQLPVTPFYPNLDSFKGITLHSAAYKDCTGWAGKHGVVVGSANTAHDVAEDMLDAGLASVTMVQRSETFVIPADLYGRQQSKTYNPEIPTEVADRLTLTPPMAVARLMFQKLLHGDARQHPEKLDALEKAGFKTDRFGDLIHSLAHRFGGYYMDVGASAKIGQGLIKVKSDSQPVSWTENGLQFANGDHLRADVVVFATGFVGNMRLQATELFGNEIGDQLEDSFGLDEEGEQHGVFKPLPHPAFSFHGGAMAPSRFYSRFTALSIKAKTMKSPFPVYKETPPRNTWNKKVKA